MSDNKMRKWLAMMRIIVGALFIHSAVPKFSVGFLQGFADSIRTCAQANPFPWYKSFLTSVVLPNEQVFAILLVLLELLVGVALLIGFLTGLASLMGMLFTVNHLLATSHLAAGSLAYMPSAIYSPNLFLLMLLLLFLLTRAGRVWGVDSRIGSSKGWLW